MTDTTSRSSTGTKLLPCPFCGCEGQKFKDFWDSGEIDCFGCKDCAISFERADEWNARPGAAAQRLPDRGIIDQHIGCLKQYVEGMTEANWRDMRLHAERQLERLCEDMPDPAYTAKQPPKCLCCEEVDVANDGDECERCRITYSVSSTNQAPTKES